MIDNRMQLDPRPAPPPDDRLDSWKEIAAYLRKGVRTVQRWERTEGLPVRRHGQDRKSVFAYKSEIDAWWQAQGSHAPAESSPEPEAEAVAEPEASAVATPEATHPRWLIPAALSLTGIIALVLVWNLKPAGPVRYRPIPLTSDPGWESHPSFSPDGQDIAYTWAPESERPAIYVQSIGSSPPRRLTTGPAAEASPAWSPDGRRIAFLRAISQKPGGALFVIPAGGGPETKIAELVGVSRLAWSADGQWLVFVDGPMGKRSITAVSVTTGVKHALTDPFEFGYMSYGLSRDARRLVYASKAPGATPIFEQALGPGLEREGPPRRLPVTMWARDLLVTPGAEEIIYSADDGFEEGVDIRRLKLRRGAEPERIYSGSSNYSALAISADGRRLAFAVNRHQRVSTWSLALGKSGAKPAPLLASTHQDLNPQYSPDGRRIAFHSTRTGASDIWVANSDGSHPWRLTFTNARTTATPRWSPDGEWIAFESNQAGQTEVYVVRSTGGAVRRITNHPAVDAIPEWSRDGRFLYFCSDRTGRFEVWKVPVAGGEPVQITRDGGFSAVESRDGKYLYYSQRRNFGPVMRMPVAGGPAEQIIPDSRGLFYAVATHGIYFRSSRSIAFWDAATGRINDIFTPSKPTEIGLAISPDDQTLLFTQLDLEDTDLYMIDGLR